MGSIFFFFRYPASGGKGEGETNKSNFGFSCKAESLSSPLSKRLLLPSTTTGEGGGGREGGF